MRYASTQYEFCISKWPFFIRRAVEESESACATQKAETRIIAVELNEAQVKSQELAERTKVAEARTSDLEALLSAAQESNVALIAERDALAAEKKVLEENAFSGDLYDEALDKIDKLEGTMLFSSCCFLASVW